MSVARLTSTIAGRRFPGILVLISALVVGALALPGHVLAQTHQVWVQQYNHHYSDGSAWPGSADSLRGTRCVAVDSAGRVLVTGKASNGSNNDYLTVAYDSAGNQLWAQTYDGGGADQAFAVAVDSADRVLVAGYSSNGSDNDYLTVAYDSAGTQLWAKTYDGGGADQALAVAVDSADRVLVTGVSSSDYLTVAYDSAGTQLWAKTYDSGGFDQASNVAVDSADRVMVTGFSWNGSTNDYLTVAYDSSGNQLWTGTEPPTLISSERPGYYSDFADWDWRLPGKSCVALNASGNLLVVTGRTSNGSNNDFLTVAYDSAGNLLWAQTYDSGNYDEAYAVAVDSADHVLVTGFTGDGSYIEDYLTVAYDSAGNLLWAQDYDSGSVDEAYAVAVDSADRVWVTGKSSNGLDNDSLTVVYDSAGNQVWTTRYEDDADNQTWAAVSDGAGNVYVVGNTSLRGGDFLIIKYGEMTLPTVTLVDSVNDTGDGQVSEDELTGAAINQLLVTFSEAMAAGAGDAGGYLLYSDGGDGFDTLDCSYGVDPDDVPVAVDSAAWHGPDLTTTIGVNGGLPLPSGSYRLHACSSLTDEAGNPLDGDGDGYRGYDFVRTFHVDTVAPSTVSDIVSTSHTDTPLNDCTIDMEWTAATDDFSGVHGYAVEFSLSDTWTCDENEDLGADATAHTSGWLDTGDWWFHICTVDEVGNWSGVASAGPFAVDVTEPTVTLVHTVSDTGDGQLGASEHTESSITQLYVSFSEEVQDPAGDSGGDDVTNPDNFLLVAAGADGTIETVGCFAGASSADVQVPVTAVEYDSGASMAALWLPTPLCLAAERYRLFACGSTSILDLAGGPLDGDGDGTGGDDFGLDFSVVVTNLLRNPNLDVDTGHWTLVGPPVASLIHSIDDADGAPTSGSAYLKTFDNDEVLSMIQCVNLPELDKVELGSYAFVSGTSSTSPTLYGSAQLYDGLDCTGAVVATASTLPLTGNTGGLWTPVGPTIDAVPPEARSADVAFVVDPEQAPSVNIRLDNLYFGEPRWIFGDGFESGDTTIWSVTFP